VSTDLRALMERDGRRRLMLGDPDLTGDLLLFAFALDEVIFRKAERRAKRQFGESWVLAVEEMVCAPLDPQYKRDHGAWVKARIGGDIPRYEFLDEPGKKCVAPMVRREGTCGAPGGLGVVDRDPVTGEGHRVWLCRRHEWLAEGFRARVAEWKRNGEPSPPPNAGGVLERYYAGDWDELYRWAHPWKKPMRGGREATPPRPKLRLIQGGDESEVES